MTKRTIERAAKDADNPYRMISRSAMEDDRLTFEARGILAYILVKPDNWRVQVADLRRAGNMGRDKTYRILNELIAFGYVIRESGRNEDGTIGETVYRVNEKPTVTESPSPEKPDTAEPFPEKPDTAEPDTAEPLPVNTDCNNKEENTSYFLTNKEWVDDDDDRARAATFPPPDSSRRRLDPLSASTKQAPPTTDTSAVVRLQQILPTRNEGATPLAGRRDRRSNAEYDAVCKAIENNGFGMMTPILADKVNVFMDAYPTDWIVRALATATAANKLRLDYVGGILENWKREGFGYDQRHHHRERSGNGIHPPTADTDATRRQRSYNERYTRLLADEINQVITRDAAAQQWQQLETEFPDYEYKELP